MLNQNLYKAYDAFEIIDEMNQLEQLKNIYNNGKLLDFNVSLTNNFHDCITNLNNWINKLKERWEGNYGEQFKAKEYLPANSGIRDNNAKPFKQPGTPNNDNARTEQEDTWYSQEEDDNNWGEDIAC